MLDETVWMNIEATPAQRTLLIMMDYIRDVIDRNQYLRPVDAYVSTMARTDTDEGRMFAWLIEQAGGIWTWRDGQPVFVSSAAVGVRDR